MKIVLAVFMVALLFCGCDAVAEPETPVVTTDDIEPNTTADEVVNALQEMENFDYFWFGESLEETLAAWNSFNPDEVASEVNFQQSIQTVITAQEAANIVGNILVAEFGMEKEIIGQEMLLEITKTAPDYWAVHSRGYEYSFDAQLNHTTGEIKSFSCTASSSIEQHFKNLMAIQPNEAFVVTATYLYDADEIEYIEGYWDRNHPGFNSAVEAMKTELVRELSGSGILNSANITDIQLVQDETHLNKPEFTISLDNSEKLTALKLDGYTDYDYNGYPLSAYSFRYDDILL